MQPLDRREFFKQSLAFASVISFGPLGLRPAGAAQPEFQFEPEKPLILAPTNPALWPQFQQQLAAWREQKRRELNYSDTLYRREDFQWVPASFACCFLMLCDERFYDGSTGRYNTKAFCP